jgi:hypothetical protein
MIKVRLASQKKDKDGMLVKDLVAKIAKIKAKDKPKQEAELQKCDQFLSSVNDTNLPATAQMSIKSLFPTFTNLISCVRKSCRYKLWVSKNMQCTDRC